ncbi:undecaprenyl-diphosphate phosphatase [Streptomyces sp. NPDC004232]|uniref:undecaprenyl-diphosphate phosphatase n=1 Tax=Streptomyces sp. NPDC004232 TaxID=3154454 RepID=UPI0033B368F6
MPACSTFRGRSCARVIRALTTSVTRHRIQTVDQKLAWLILTACVPVAVAGVALDGIVLFVTEQLRRGGTGRRRAGATAAPGEEHLSADEQSDLRITRLTIRQAVAIGAAQILALLPGISRTGSTISAGIFKGMDHEDSARLAFLHAAPVIGGAALLKLPPLLGALGNGLRGPLLAGSVAAFVAAYLAPRYLARHFEHRALIPFSIYCSVVGLGSLAYFAVT